MSTISDIVADPLLAPFKFDFAKQAASGKKLGIAKFRIGGKPFKVTIKGTVGSNGISSSEFGDGKNKKSVFSLGIVPDDDADLSALTTLADNLTEWIPEDVRAAYECVDLVKGDRFYLKLPLSNDKKSFKCQSNIPINPKKAQDADISSDQEIEVTVELSAYFNFDDQKAGLMLNCLKLNFPTHEDAAIPDEMPTPTPAAPPAKKSRLTAQ
jgi:hypothetical protein